MIALFDSAFDLIGSFFALLGWVFIMLGFGFGAYITLFSNRAVAVRARVIDHVNQAPRNNADTGEMRTSYRTKFEVADGRHAGAQYTSHEIQDRNAFLIDTIWPARFDPGGGAIRTERTLSFWPWMCASMIGVGIAFVLIPKLPSFDREITLGYAFMALGFGIFVFGLISHSISKKRQARALFVEVELIAIDIAYDTERRKFDVPIFKIRSGDYAEVECSVVDMAGVNRSDIGTVMTAAFDAYSGALQIVDERFAAPPSTKPLLITGLTFALIGTAIKMDLFH